MKLFLLTGTFLAALLLSSCEFHQSTEKDLITGAYTRGDGLGYEDIVLKINDKAEKRNTFVFGEKVLFEFNNMTGFNQQNNKAFPALSMCIIKNEKDTVSSYPNLLDDISEGTDLYPLRLEANFTATMPHKNNEKYKLHVRIWDTKGKGNLVYEFPFTIKENKSLNIIADRMEYTSIYLWNESLKKMLVDKKVNRNDELMLLLNGINGLEIKNGKVYPVLSLELEDSEGKKIISNPNILSDYESEGISPEILKAQVPVTLTFSKGQLHNPYKLIAIVKDQNSSKKITVETELEIY